MDGEPGFAEPGGRIKTGQGKKVIKLTGYTSNGGRFSLDTFFVRTKKVSRHSHSVAGEKDF